MSKNIVSLRLAWGTCGNNPSTWCGLRSVDLTDSYFDQMEGVYVIWNGTTGAVVRVGQGVIRDRLGEHREDPEILRHAGTDARATWARVAPEYRDGVELYLAERYSPVVGTLFPNVTPTPVNLPGE